MCWKHRNSARERGDMCKNKARNGGGSFKISLHVCAAFVLQIFNEKFKVFLNRTDPWRGSSSCPGNLCSALLILNNSRIIACVRRMSAPLTRRWRWFLYLFLLWCSADDWRCDWSKGLWRMSHKRNTLNEIFAVLNYNYYLNWNRVHAQ